ncbi:ABC transporter ATP-binding protein [Acidithiobacillus albertensis]|uniref:ABC transporter ATP-binding protein n=1 Tax=Acidithiobacillus albertensis TaxID=119978 RepID=UPI000A7CADEC|nr:ABC transporter ATP-binding protein [Acidithiobacillus albertensis]
MASVAERIFVSQGSSPEMPNKVKPHIKGGVELVHVDKTFSNGLVATDDISLIIEPGCFYSLLGPSGCGKTTLLRMIAGFDRPDAGDIRIAGKSILGIPAYRRSVNTVFQSYCLFPHMTIRKNIEFGLKMKKMQPLKRRQQVDEMLAGMQIEQLADRHPAELSGGQKQRVALARALINEPEVLLLDEPLSALDAKLRRELQIELSRLQKSTGITFIFVTHDQHEAMVMSDKIGIMQHGRIQQTGSACELYEHPRTVFVARFLGLQNIIRKNALTHIPAYSSSAHHLTIHPERITLFSPNEYPPEDSMTNYRGVIKDRLYKGAHTDYVVELQNGIELLVSDQSPVHHQRNPGMPVDVVFSKTDLIPLEE